MREFCNYHPTVAFLYFVCVIVFTCLSLNPISVSVAFLAAFTYSAVLKGRDAFLKNLLIMPVLFVGMALINPAFNHRGVTILAYLPSGNPLTLESVCFGLIASAMVLSMILYFSCFNEVMTSDKIIYLFGKISPSISLVFSMALRAVPKFIRQFKEIIKVQKAAGRDAYSGNLVKRAKNGLTAVSAMLTWVLEDAIETADSMKSRGYGLPGRTAYSVYTFTKRDKKAILFIALTAAYTAFGMSLGKLSFNCFPSIKIAEISPYVISVFFAELMLMAMPVIIEITEHRKWKYTK